MSNALSNPVIRKRVAVFRKDLLPLSETFILDQFRSYRLWEPHLVGYQRIAGLEFQDTHLYTMTNNPNMVNERLNLRIAQYSQFFGIYPSRLKRIFGKIKPDIIHAHFGYDAILVSGIAEELKIPLVVTLHGDDILRSRQSWRSGARGFFFRFYPHRLDELIKNESVYFISVSNAMRERALEQGVPGGRITTLYTGCDNYYFSPTKNPPNQNEILFVGRLAEFKGCEFLIKAMALLQREIPSARLRIIGDGPERERLRKIAEELKVVAIFDGAVDRSHVKAAMHNASIFYLPSISESSGSFESFGMVILEAQMCGLPVITSARGGSEIVKSGETGFVFPEKDIHALAAQLRELMTNETFRVEMAKRGREKALAEFTLASCTAKIEQLYDSIVAKSNIQRAVSD